MNVIHHGRNGSFQKRSKPPPQRKFPPSGEGGEKTLFLIMSVNSKGTGTITWPPSLKPLMMVAMYVWSGKYATKKTFVFDH